MGKIVVSENVSLDGVIQDPTGTEGFRFAGWFDELAGSDREAWAKAEFAEALASDALLLGRRTYEWFVARGWASRGGDWPDRLRALPKFVLSTTIRDPEWQHTTVRRGDLGAVIAELRREIAGDIVVYGSGQLAHALIEHDLVDELRLMLCPFVLGEGQRVFGRLGDRKAMRLVESRVVGDGLVRVSYRPA
jgi:dihydrofolate reductase